MILWNLFMEDQVGKTMKLLKYTTAALILLFSGSIIVIVSIWGECLFEDYNSTQSVRANLLRNIESYQTIDEFKKNFDLNSFQWEEEFGDSLYKIKIKEFKHHNFIGILNITFFNNRLYAVAFYPNATDFNNYIQELSIRNGIQFVIEQNGQFISYTSQNKFTKVYGSNANNNVVWLDSRLEKEYIRWG